eukprot:TRINITY_DN8734_c2_g1_i1.p1 TRINITY_DN8734_c2_g1~~TRINITY_DN8734_c2_g1_i1.p1  ORF type:complete len:255 (-),score=43.34 TRINITY_DN8734_c2_g1_i1:165-929(-)
MSTADLVDQVKSICRQDINAKNQWCAWCDSNAEGTKDPNRLTPDMLTSFLSAFHGGQISVGGKGGGKGGFSAASPGGGTAEIAQFVKLGQKFSPAWKVAWSQYCTTYGEGCFDPARHSFDFLQNFLELVGTGGVEIMNSDPITRVTTRAHMLGGGPPAKRPRTALGGSYGGSVGGGSYGGSVGGYPSSNTSHSQGSEGDRIAQQIKQMQKLDPVKKQMWSDFCDQNYTATRGQATKDPTRVPLDQLREFMHLVS